MQPVISETDHIELRQLIVKQKNHEVKFLKTLLNRLKITREKDFPKNTIRLNSLVIFWNSFLKRIIKLRIVLPDKEDLRKRNISVLSPISLALMGHKEKDNLTVSVPGVKKKLRILRVINH